MEENMNLELREDTVDTEDIVSTDYEDDVDERTKGSNAAGYMLLGGLIVTAAIGIYKAVKHVKNRKKRLPEIIEASAEIKDDDTDDSNDIPEIQVVDSDE